MTTEDKALALALAKRLRIIPDQNGLMYEDYEDVMQAADLIEQHEAFRQEVSDECIVLGFKPAPIGIGRFIIPALKPDPLVSAMDKLEWCNTDALAKDLRDTLDALGFEIREKNDG